MSQRITKGILHIDPQLYDFVENQLSPNTGVEMESFWSGFSDLVAELSPKNKQLLIVREQLQQQIDQWHLDQGANTEIDQSAYQAFLEEIGYLSPEPSAFNISTIGVDTEIADIPGPQLVVPVMNARFALNATNARWGSLYDALYGTDAIAEDDGAHRQGAYNPVRGGKVVEFAMRHMDAVLPLENASHASCVAYRVVDGHCVVTDSNHAQTGLKQPDAFVAYVGDAESPNSLLFKINGLHIEVQIDRTHQIGRDHPAGVKDIILESALTAIQDCEDSVAAVDAEDKVLAYGNWLGLMKGDLTAEFQKGGKTAKRTLASDRHYLRRDGQAMTLPGRSLLFVRNVGHLMTNPAILIDGDQEIPEGIMDAVMTSFCSLHDLQRQKQGGMACNSRQGSIYIVKPKMHGPEEVAFASALFGRVEQLFGLAANTIKMGIMDEERRTSANLKACINAASERVVFINTGFLDRTGDEIHTSMLAGPMIRKSVMKSSTWISAYENRNVEIGLNCGLAGKAQIGKGMWAIPDNMADMLMQKSSHPKAGANCAWVPSPTAATLHATHYHQINVHQCQADIANRSIGTLNDLLAVPLLKETLNPEDIQQELDNNAQSTLGYVVRWVEQGVGCSKVPDIHNVGLMEDRATLRISCQHMANWLHHGLCSEAQIVETFQRMAVIVDQQNASDPLYRPMSADYNASHAFQAACDLVFKGADQPSGYTEPLLHAWRQRFKAGQ